MCPAGAHTNTLSGQCYDVLLDGGTLSVGTYQIALTTYENMSYAENLGTGALAVGFTGLGNLGDGEDLHYAFAVTLTPATTTVTPEPLPLGFAKIFEKPLLAQVRAALVQNVDEPARNPYQEYFSLA